MNTDDLLNLADDPRFIPSIYNYCDRWCERCPFTARCLNYAMGAEMEGREDIGVQDTENAQFWDGLGQVLENTLDLLHALAEREGVQPLSDEEWAHHQADEERKWAEAEAHPAVALAEMYIQTVDEWLESAGPLFAAKADELTTYLRLNLPGGDPEAKAAELRDAVEVIRWYQLFIQVKLMRALSGKEDDAADPLDEYPKDSDGSAKIALIAMDRSLAAWTILLRAFPQREVETLRLLAYLERIRRLTEQEFPQARAFVRPGFDGPAEETPAEEEDALWEEVWNEVWETPDDDGNHATKR
ncbi:MAG: hypothetical protein DYG89_50940 [Caldilinea sp. CFX5]|nr:hypothetical protein [Caldilinea sp. CFX5]